VSFQARNLRVQLPSGDSMVFDEGVAGDAVASDEKIIKPVCLDAASFYVGSCFDFFTTALLVKTATIAALDAEQLPALREHLEARLKEIDDAERARANE
jgi:hypothetical protein